MLKERDLDIVLVGTPDHWHALPMIEAVKSGVDVWVQKPVSVDVVEGQAMLAAARQYKRVVQVGMQRRSTPHLIHAKDRDHQGRQARHHRARRDLLLLPHAGDAESAGWTAAREPRLRDVDRAGADAALQLARASAQLARLHGIRQRDPRRHVRAHARHGALDARPRDADPIDSTGGILVDKKSKANITDTQTATFDFPNLRVVWTHRSYGSSPDPTYPWGATFYGDKGTLKASVNSFDFIPQAKGEAPIHEDVVMELEQFPEDKTEKDLERHVAPAIRGHMKNFLECIGVARQPGRRHRAGLHVDGRLHPGQHFP